MIAIPEYVVFTLLGLYFVTILVVGKLTKNSEGNFDIPNIPVPYIQVKLTKIENGVAYFVCDEVKKMYTVKFDSYDLEYSEIQPTYNAVYRGEGWGRPILYHNDKPYKMYEI